MLQDNIKREHRRWFDMTVLHDAGLGLLVPTLSVRDNPFFFQKGGYKFLCNSHKERTIQPFWDCVTFSNNTSSSGPFTKITLAREALHGTQISHVKFHPFWMASNRF
jgi:hypothetical protein